MLYNKIGFFEKIELSSTTFDPTEVLYKSDIKSKSDFDFKDSK